MTSQQETTQACTWDGSAWMTPAHLAACDNAACRGCRPCGEHHCAFRGRCPNHVDVDAGLVTCPRCVGKVRSDLTAVENLAALMPAEAAFAGVDSEAANLAGPAADVDQYATRQASEERIRIYRDAIRNWCEWPRDQEPDDQHHPYAVLARWEKALREDYGHRSDLLTNVSRAADYIRTLMRTTSFPHGLEFEAFARDITRCRVHLEAVVHDSRTPEQGRPCPACTVPGKPGERLQKRYADHDRSGASDTWHCPACGTAWSEADYRLRVGADYVEHAPALTVSQLAERLDVKRGTLTGWAAKGEVRRRGKDQHGRQLYDVADVIRMQSATRTA